MIDEPLYFYSISNPSKGEEYWNDLYNQSGKGGKFHINIARRLNTNRLFSRNGEWSLPWKQEIIPGFEMPLYDSSFNKSFSDISDSRALDILDKINQGKQIAVMYSGGIDSTVIMVSILKNIPENLRTRIVVCASSESLIENPSFWKNHIKPNFKIIDSSKVKYDDLIEQGFVPVTADEGDCIFGTVFGLNLYYNYDFYIKDLSFESRRNLENIKNSISDTDVHWKRYEDIIIRHLSIGQDDDFGKLFYEKISKNINTSSVPVVSLHDFFWWIIFNLKYVNCSIRGALYYNDRLTPRESIYSIINWFNGREYQLWSMNNNNKGLKIKKTPATYKFEAKQYIWEYDKNHWFKSFKSKIESLWNIGVQQDVSMLSQSRKPVHRAGLDKNLSLMYITDNGTKEFFKNKIINCDIDW